MTKTLFSNPTVSRVPPFRLCLFTFKRAAFVIVGWREPACQTVYANTGWKIHKCHKFSRKQQMENAGPNILVMQAGKGARGAFMLHSVGVCVNEYARAGTI